MTKQKSTKRALLASVLSLVLCISMLVGSTFAWFTDSATTGVNKIVSGNLDIVLEYRDADGKWTETDANTKLFKEGALWEPGYTEVVYLKVTNNGSLALNYQLAVNVAEEVAGKNVLGESFKLSDYIQFGKVVSKDEIKAYATREEAQAAATDVTTLQSYSKTESLLAGEATYVALVVYMPTTVGNEANHNGNDEPSIELGVNVVATQYTSESDSFNSQYDAAADFIPTDAKVTEISTAEELVAFATSNNTSENVYVKLVSDIDMTGVAYTSIANFADTFNGYGHTISNMTTNLFGTVSGTVKNLNVENVNVLNTSKGGANGFIGTVAEGGLVDNCKVSDVTITWPDTLKDTCDCYGGIINRVNTGATVQNCEFANITMTGHGYVKRSSAVFAEVSGKISGCTVDGVTLNVINDDKATGDAYTKQVGGIIADLYNGAEVSDCEFNNVILVIDDATNTGGIIGKAYVTDTAGPCEITLKDITVNNLTMNMGNTIQTGWSTVSNVGGFIGQMDSRYNDSHLTMDNCHIKGLDMTLASNKKGEDPSGGFIASLNGGADITNCSVSGKIDGTNEYIGVGGFLGTVGGYAAKNDYTINITDCSANVAITGNDNIFVGGFVAYAGSYNQTMTKNLALNFTNCEATGSFYGVKDTNETEVTTFTGCKVDGADFAG